MEKQESWKPVVGYEDFYEVSDLGRVRSLPRKWVKGRIRKLTPDDKGYLRVGLSKNGKHETCKVHQLVMEAFVGRCPDGYEVDHYDWNPSNNRLDNLSYQPKEVNRTRRSPEGRKNQSEAMKKVHQDPEYQKKIAETNKKLSQDPEWLRKNAEGVKRRSQNKEWRKNTAEAVRKALCKPVDQFTLDGQFVKRWPSATDAARELGIRNGNISNCCKGRCKSSRGFAWRYAQ